MKLRLTTASCTLAALALGACTTNETGTGAVPQLYPGTPLIGELSGAAVQPTQGDADGSGQFALWVDRDTTRLCYDLGVTGIENPTGAHIHRGGPTETGAVVVTLNTPDPLHSEGCVAAETELIDEMLGEPNRFYVQVHTQAHPQGALRAQLKPE